MNKKEKERLIKLGIEYGMGYVCGKHNLHISKKERAKIAKEYISELQNKAK